MNILEKFRHQGVVYSFEVFPPKTEKGLAQLKLTLGELARLEPDFISVTCGAGGGNRDNTVEICAHIARELDVSAVAHVTCSWADRAQLGAMLDAAAAAGVEGVMALRGDPPKGESTFVAPTGGFAHASDLVRMIRDEKRPFFVGVAGYPEKHPESATPASDLEFLKLKVDQGADLVVTQLFFDNQLYFDFVARARDRGIAVPIVPGIMPIANYAKILEFCAFSSTSMPRDLALRMERVQHDPERTLAEGAAYAIEQIRDLLAGGAPGFHIYVLNQARSAKIILDALALGPR